MAVDDSYTKSLLHFELISASTDFIDESGKAWTTVGTPAITNTQYKFQNGSGYFTIAGGCAITTPNHADFNVGSDDFTVECWIKLETIGTGDAWICTKLGTGTTSDECINLRLTSDKYPQFTLRTTSSFVNIIGVASDAITSDDWHHIAGVLYTGNMSLYVDGYLVGTGAFADAVNTNTNVFAVGGRAAGANPFPGWIDEFRFSKGIARYTAAFTPPTGPFGVSSGSESMYFADGYSIY